MQILLCFFISISLLKHTIIIAKSKKYALADKFLFSVTSTYGATKLRKEPNVLKFIKYLTDMRTTNHYLPH